MKSSLFIFLGLFFLLGCSEDFFSPIVEVDIPEAEKKLVAFSHIEEGEQKIYALVTKNRKITDPMAFPLLRSDTSIVNTPQGPWKFVYNDYAPDTVTSVKVEVFKNERFWLELTRDPKFGLYFSAALGAPIRFEVGDRYTIRVSAPGYETIEATENMPAPVALDTFEIRKNIRVVNPSDPFIQDLVDEYTLVFVDPAFQTNYYQADIKFSDSTGQESVSYGLTSLELNAEYGMMRDESFNGQMARWKVHELNRISGHGFRYYYLELGLRSISESMFTYQLSLNRYYETKDNPFAEPTILYTNFKGGYGLFSLASKRTKKIKI
jgi:hypothetical protein